MKRFLAVGVLLGAAVWAAAAAGQPRIKWASIAALEKTFDTRLKRASVVEPLDLLGTTRGIYLPGYGVVFTSEVDLIISPNISPFHQSFTKQEIARIRARKLERLPLLKQNMREMLIASAAALEAVPPAEQIVVGVSLFHFSWEDTTGLPSQIVMLGQRQKLLSRNVAESDIHTEEY